MGKGTDEHLDKLIDSTYTMNYYTNYSLTQVTEPGTSENSGD